MVTFEDDYQYEGNPYVKVTAMTELLDISPIKKNGLYLFGGVDPVDNTWKISYVLYPKFQIGNSPGFTLESAKDATSKTDWASANTSCKICNKANKALGNTNMIDEQVSSIEIQSPVQYSQRVTSRDIVPISAISSVARLGQKVVCKPAGKMLLNGLFATFFDYVSGSASDPGLKGSLDEMASSFLADADVCDDERAQLQKDLVTAYGVYRNTGSFSAALMSLMFRNIPEIFSGKGLAVTRTQKENKVVQTSYQLGPASGNRMIG
jgi:hypothetical protein